MFLDDTIVAISSATGPAARMIVRVSGSNAPMLATGLGAADAGSAGRATLKFADLSCPAWVYQFVAPHSYTGQNLLELHIPGNPLLARMLVDWLLAHGARPAEPGEFTARAYFNGKIDLAQAEGVAAAISAQSRQQLTAARQLMAGELSRRLQPTMDLLAEFLALIEAGIDFSDEGIQFVTPGEAARRIAAIQEQLQDLVARNGNFQRLAHEPAIVLAGRPNAGKSTLLNALAGQERCIVSPEAGTTRDVLSAQIVLRRGMAVLIDVAGLQEPSDGGDPSDEIQHQMRQHAWRAIEESDVVILVRDATDNRPAPPLPRSADLLVISKIDLVEGATPPPPAIDVSAAANINMELLREALDRLAFGSDAPGAALALTSRHLQAIEEAAAALRRAENHLEAGPEIVAAELRRALDSLGQIRGVVTPDDILGKIFSMFCIGK